ncbi:MAG: hypothetical protein EXS48_03525 [Candidatus Staskawiczbacteria bacterium]|nr:hypothetical protein [Candidatus Staskawiczbacteria bacterium]
MNLDPVGKFFRNSNKVMLDQKKKDDMHQEVLRFMKNNPIKERGILMRWFSLKAPVVALAGMLLFLGLGGIASVQADSSLPGDFLYPIKIGFNEKIQEVLAFSDQAKLKLNIDLTEIRLKEAAELVVKNKMDDKLEAKVRNNFKIRADKASKYIDKINKKAMKIDELKTTTTNFEASLRAQSSIINDLKKRPNNKVTNEFISDIKDVTSKISERNKDKKDSFKLDNMLK